MKRTLIITALLAFVIVIAGAFTYAQKERENRRDNMREKMVEKLNLTDQQQTQIEEFRFTHQKEMIDLRADVKRQEIELQELKIAGNFSRADYLSKVENIVSANNKIEMIRANHQMDVYEILNADQQKIWNDKAHKFHGRKNKSNYRQNRKFNCY